MELLWCPRWLQGLIRQWGGGGEGGIITGECAGALVFVVSFAGGMYVRGRPESMYTVDISVLTLSRSVWGDTCAAAHLSFMCLHVIKCRSITSVGGMPSDEQVSCDQVSCRPWLGSLYPRLLICEDGGLPFTV